ncbi:cAMP-regulated phosphoprotein 19-A [Fasciola hepatica]|uniref:cAMP-regulated phosphoprotein 19-A n=1 Tax=Fasciola hepatica TaxID=6192 RepID=A0A4E0RW86_FASHE|nr:cAMP-regulated phosphoprotein 19-A [Fasciola hepatica]
MQDPHVIERLEEEKLKKKFPGLNKNVSAILQRRLSKNVKYFDSGDYNMAKTNVSSNAVRDAPIGETIPTPENILVLRNRNVSPQLALGAHIAPPTSPARTSMNLSISHAHPQTNMSQ